MKGSAFPFVFIVLLTIAVAGCAPRRAQYDDLYARLVEEPAALDWSVLEGRTIVIDPGHGGRFDGVVGIDSLREADANLGVALYLWGLLSEAGADVHLTRTTDRDFTAADSTDLREDLERRTALANALEPEVFISIHHNSNLPLDRGRNSVEIYYRSENTGASLELANDIHTHLARNLGIEESKIKPASYYVLRNSTAQAAVLGEASYLSNPSVEEKLKLSVKQKLEGEAYFLGLVSYFSRGIPVIERFFPARDTVDAPGTIAFRVTPGADIPIDPVTAMVRVGKRIYNPLFDTDGAILRCALHDDLPNGRYEVICTARSIRGGTASSRPFMLLVSRPPRFMLPLPPIVEPEDRLSLAVKVLDENGSPVADGEEISIRSSGGACRGTCHKGIFRFEVDREGASEPYVAEMRGLIDTLRFACPTDEKRFPILVVDATSGERITHPQATPMRGGGCAGIMGDTRGLLLIPIPSAATMDTAGGPICEWIVSTRGYQPEILRYMKHADGGYFQDVAGGVTLRSLYGGVLHGMRIAIDPGGGGDDHGGLGRGKLRGATVNLEIARRLGTLLARGGAEVMLTRRGDETISQEERIYKVNSFGPELALRLSLAQSGQDDPVECAVLHYPGSERGVAIADNLAARLADLPPCPVRSLVPSADRFLQQTNCPAVEIRGGAISSRDAETMLSKPVYAQLEAERILAAIISYAGEGTVELVEQSVRILEGGEPVVGAAVSIDMTVTQYTDVSGIARFTCTVPGRHLLTAKLPGEPSPLLAFPLSITDGSLRVFSIER
jgi:N-acetylmuramoyl-L-alanine amidase